MAHEFRAFLIASFHPAVAFYLPPPRTFCGRYRLRRTESTCLSSVSVFSHNECSLLLPISFRLVCVFPRLYPRTQTCSRSSSSSFCTSSCLHCAASPLSPALSPPRNTFGRLARDFSSPRGLLGWDDEVDGFSVLGQRQRERERERAEMCMLRYLAQAVTLSVQSVHQVAQQLQFRSVSRSAKWSGKKSPRVSRGKTPYREHRFVEGALFQS